MSWRVGVDSGGTSTDHRLFDDEGGRLAAWKVASTPDGPSRAVAQGLGEGTGRVGRSLRGGPPSPSDLLPGRVFRPRRAHAAAAICTGRGPGPVPPRERALGGLHPGRRGRVTVR